MLAQLGLDVGEPQDAPEDVYLSQRIKIDTNQRQSSPTKRAADPLKKFLENDRKVLRFFCYWDDRASPFGDIRQFVSTLLLLSFFLG